MSNPELRKLFENPEEVSTIFTGLLTSAIHDESPVYSFSDLLSISSDESVSSQIDAIYAVESLVPIQDPDARGILRMVGRKANAKEILIAVQERVEALEHTTDADSEEENVENERQAEPIDQLIVLVSLYTASIPRLTLRKKNAHETVEPLLADLNNTISAIAPSANRSQGRELIQVISELVITLSSWVKTTESTELIISNCLVALRKTLDVTLTSATRSIQASLATRAFIVVNPRLAIPGRDGGESGWEGGVEVMKIAIKAANSLDLSSVDSLLSLARSPTTGMMPLILLAHRPTDELKLIAFSSSLLTHLLPLIAASLIPQAPALDHALCILVWNLLSPSPLPSLDSPSHPSRELSPEVASPLLALLPPLSATHAHPPMRHVAFRLLSATLRATPDIVRLDALAELVGPTCPSEALRVASVGLVKEAILDAFSTSETVQETVSTVKEKRLFASSLLFDALGGVLFRPDEPFQELLSSAGQPSSSPDEAAVNKFLGSSEPARLTECLGLYYILLKRDTKNATGVRDIDKLKTVREGLLEPLEVFIDIVISFSSHSTVDEARGHAHGHENDHDEWELALVPLQTALLRVNDALWRGQRL